MSVKSDTLTLDKGELCSDINECIEQTSDCITADHCLNIPGRNPKSNTERKFLICEKVVSNAVTRVLSTMEKIFVPTLMSAQLEFAIRMLTA